MLLPLFLNDVAGSEIIVIILVVLIFFGSKSIPGIAKTLGKTLYQIKNASAELQNEIKKSGFDIDIHSHKIKVNSSSTVFYKGKRYNISKKDINHGTNSCLCTIKIEDEAITKLKASSTKLEKVLSAL